MNKYKSKYFCVAFIWPAPLFGLLVSVLQVGVVLVGEHGLDVTPDQGQEQGHAQAGGDKVEQGGLGVFVNMHHGDCSQEASQVRCKNLRFTKYPEFKFS